ncbi:MAG TPA: lipid A export permease/ATP-binding protein MsbA [Burkholderiaceae bacterium]|nr:lipid A export permease/ATP-binding protein MsbA [Burkholderiaceae bacterium]
MNDSRTLYRRLLGYVRPYRRSFALAAICMIVAAVTEPVFARFMGLLIDRGFKGDVRNLWIAPLFIVVLFSIRGVSQFSASYLLAYVSNRILLDMRRQMFAKLVRLPVPFLDRHPSASLITKLTADVTNVGGASTQVITILIRDSVAVIGLLGLMFYRSWQLTLITFVILPIIGVFAVRIGKRLREMNRRSQEATGDLLNVLQEATEGQKVVKIYGGQSYEEERFDTTNRALRGYAMRIAAASSASSPLTQFFGGMAFAGVVTAAIYQSTVGGLTAGNFTEFMSAMLLLMPALKQLADINGPLQRGVAAGESVFELLDAPVESNTGTVTLQRARGEIVFDHVSLRYPQTERDALSMISLAIAPGESVALVGGSGGGKTSLANLLPRFYTPTSGQVRLDGHPLETLTLESLRSQIALVSQDVVLFNDTIAANIAYGAQRDASRAEIEAAVHAAYLDDFVRAQPQGLDTMIGENGVRLSGGQRQRLAIARAILKNAPILILDEATSALDSESERHVQAAIERLMHGRTTLVIAHRLSTIERVDRIVVLDQGRIVEVGTHRELISRGGLYSRLYSLQYAARDVRAT